jgi:hypothetical protein
MIEAVHPRLQQLRSNYLDPAHGGTAATKRSESVSRNNKLSATVDPTKRPTSQLTSPPTSSPSLPTFRYRLLPRRQALSESYCSFTRRGIEIPHERHWEKLWSLVESVPAEQ